MKEKITITKESCKKIIIDLLTSHGQVYEEIKHANEFCDLIADPVYKTKNGVRQIQRAVKELQISNIIEKDEVTKFFRIVQKDTITDTTIKTLLDRQELKAPILLSEIPYTVFLPVGSRNNEFVMTLITSTNINDYIITMVPTYNGIIIYAHNEHSLNFKEYFKKITGYSISK